MLTTSRLMGSDWHHHLIRGSRAETNVELLH